MRSLVLSNRTSRIADAFQRCAREDRTALVTYVMGGDPNLRTSQAMALACVRGGADLLEIGIPFSDPIADGPTIQHASERSLRAGTTLSGCIDLAGALRRQTDVPLILMGYVNPVLALGVRRFFERCQKAGVDAVILPDLPPEEAVEFCDEADAHHVGMVFLLAPTSTPERTQAACAKATAFLYFVSVTGVTGARAELPFDLGRQLRDIRKHSRVPVVIGFGVSTPEQARTLGQMADGVVVGSAIVSRVAENGTAQQRAIRVERFVKQLRRGIQPSTP